MTDEKKLPLLAVVGPTASGKSRLAVLLAERLGGEILSCDSMQIYRGMDIGTAKPTIEEMRGIPHHLIDCQDPHVPFSCADYARAAKPIIGEIHGRGKLPILCGGTGLYLDRLISGESYVASAEPDEELRRELAACRESLGNEGLHRRLCEVDPESAESIHPNNVPRVMRALEIYYTTGKKKSEWDRESRMAESDYHVGIIGLRYQSRELLYDRINLRVDAMLQAGLLEETERLLRDGVFTSNSTAAQAIGYKELLGYLNGKETQTEAIESLKRATRRYAKRQMTWFSAKDYVHWIDLDASGERRSEEELLKEAFALSRELLQLHS